MSNANPAVIPRPRRLSTASCRLPRRFAEYSETCRNFVTAPNIAPRVERPSKKMQGVVVSAEAEEPLDVFASLPIELLCSVTEGLDSHSVARFAAACSACRCCGASISCLEQKLSCETHSVTLNLCKLTAFYCQSDTRLTIQRRK